MRSMSKRHTAMILALIALSVVSGCTNWRAKYEDLNVDHSNLEGRHLRAQDQQRKLSERVAQDQMTIEELRRQMEDMNKTPAFGHGTLSMISSRKRVDFANEIHAFG